MFRLNTIVTEMSIMGPIHRFIRVAGCALAHQAHPVDSPMGYIHIKSFQRITRFQYIHEEY